MDYNEILDTVNKQRDPGEVTNKLYWYIGLIQAIELFSQKLNFDQVVYTCMDSINELLTVQKSAIYVKQGDKYVIKRKKGYQECISEIDLNQKLKDLPVFHGGLLYRDTAKKYFDEKLIDELEIEIIVPLIIEDELFGFIFIGKKIDGQYDKDNYVLAEALMRLFNNALENYKNYEDIQKINAELDEKVFNLFAINQSSKVLLSELDIDKLYTLAIDVFSELTQSSVASFILFDKFSGAFSLKAYRNVFNVNEKIDIIVPYNKEAKIEPYRIILNVDNPNDMKYFKNIFTESDEIILRLKAKYFVLLIRKEEVIGIVTLSSSVTGYEYKNSIFELIESLATSTYIAISNAELFMEVNEQKELADRKFQKLIMLNNLMKNINSSKSSRVMFEMVLKTLNVAFNVEKALIARYDKTRNNFVIEETLGFKTKKKILPASKAWNRVLEGDTIFDGKVETISKYIKKDFLEEVVDFSGILISPLVIDDIDDINIYGVLIVFKYKNALITDEENKVIVQTISSHIAPILASYHELEEKSKMLVPNYIECFRRDVKEEIEDAKKFQLDLELINIVITQKSLFEQKMHFQDLMKSYRTYPISYNNAIIINSVKNDDIEKDIRAKINDDIKIERYRLNENFNSFEDLQRLF